LSKVFISDGCIKLVALRINRYTRSSSQFKKFGDPDQDHVRVEEVSSLQAFQPVGKLFKERELEKFKTKQKRASH